MKGPTTEAERLHRGDAIHFNRPVRDIVVRRMTTATAELEARHRVELEASYERGRVEGERALGELLVHQRSELMALKTSAVDALQECFPSVIRECEQTLVQLALEAARRLVAGMPVSEEMIRMCISDAISQVREATEYLVQLAPEDYAILNRIEQADTLPRDEGKMVRFEPSAAVSRGGCLVITRFGTLDSRRETKYEALKEALSS